MRKISLEQLGPLLKEKRGSRGVREVAKEIGISPATLSRVESGKQPDLDTFCKLCVWLEVDPGQVLGCAVPQASAPVRAEAEPSSAPPSKQVYAHFRSRKTVSPKTAQHLGELILAVQSAIENELAP